MSFPRLRFATLGMTAAVLVVVLGIVVGRWPDPAWMMPAEHAIVNRGALVAWWITWFGWIDVLLPLAILLLVLAWRLPVWRSRLIFVVVEMALAWRTTDLLQRLFARPRRLDWVVKHETTFSYPSSHAAVAAVVYLLLAILVARGTLRGRAWIAAALAVLACAILWSRLALGAHYITDLAGGLMWGCAVTAALAACWPTNVFEGHGHPSLE